jgi:ribosomal protein S18 acetylase RimI-like enzyme
MKPLLPIIAFLVTLLLANQADACEEYLLTSQRMGADKTIVAMIDGVEVGFIAYTKDYTRTYIEMIQIDHGYRRNGMGTRLMREMIEESRPETIQAVLAFDNWDAASELFVDGSTDESMCRDMAMRTPFYKSAARFGYTKIIDCWTKHWGFFEAVLGKI